MTFRMRRCLLVVWLLACSAVSSVAQATGINGLWTTSSGDYIVFLQDSSSGATYALQVPMTLDGQRIWVGTGSTTSVSLKGLLNPNDMLVANLGGSGAAPSGTIAIGGVQQPFTAQLAFAWVGTPYAGIWQKASPSNAYLVFFEVQTAAGRMAVQIDITINSSDKTVKQQIFTGSLLGNQFTGLSVNGAALTSRLAFDLPSEIPGMSSTLTGSTAPVGMPLQTTNFSATQIVKIAP